MHLSQPAFSRSIQAIEREVGLRLFDRETGEVKATAAGLFLIERARRLLFDARSLQRDLALYRDSQLGDIAFGVGPFPAATIMPRVLPILRRLYPGVSLRVEVSNWKLMLERLWAEDIEFFVSDVRDLPNDPRLAIESLGRQSGHFYVRAGHPLLGRVCPLPEIWQYGIAATKLPVFVKEVLGRFLGLPAGELPSFVLECDDVGLLRTLATSTDTVIAATASAVQGEVANGVLAALQADGVPVMYSQMGVVTLLNRTPSPMAQRALEAIRETAAVVNDAPPDNS